jgi:L-seryl-tRNA(Ser) seleniumtransferase
MEEASQAFVEIEELQARASRLIGDATGAQSGYITSGAASGLALSAAACIAGSSVSKMNRLPDTATMASDIVMPRTHRTTYDNAFRLAGASIVDVGSNDRGLGTGAQNTKTWEIDTAIGPDTVAVGYVYKANQGPPLEEVVEVAHENDVAVIVDAAAELPPSSNLERFVETGADLVVFSGGKAIRGPQSTGIVAGRSDLIQSIALQHLDMHVAPETWNPPSELIDAESLDGVPNQGIGRAMKVGKEELVGIIRALEEFLEEDVEQLQEGWKESLRQLQSICTPVEGIRSEIHDTEQSVAPYLTIRFDRSSPARTAIAFVEALRDGDPPIVVGADDVASGVVTINPMCLNDSDKRTLEDRLARTLEEVPA